MSHELTDYERATLKIAARQFAHGPEWTLYVSERIKTSHWVVATHLTSTLRRKGYVRAIHPDMFAQWEVEYGLPRMTAALDQLRREDEPL